MSNALTISRAHEVYAKIDNPMTAMVELGKIFHSSQIMGVTTPGDGTVLALTCMCDGITPLEFAKTYHIIKGKPSMRADMMSAKFRGAGGKVKWINLGDDGRLAEAEFTHDGQTLNIKYTIEDAKNVVGDKLDTPDSNWRKDRGAMLRARLITKAIRILAPELIAGVYTPEELADSGITPDEPAKQSTKSRADRKKELDQDSGVVVVDQSPAPTVETAQEVIIDAVVEEKVDPVSEAVSVEPVTEEPPFETDRIVNADELKSLAAAGTAAGFSIQEINTAIVETFKVASVREALVSQATAMSFKFKLLCEAIKLGAKYPSPGDKSKHMDRDEIFSTLCKKCEVDIAWKVEDVRIQNLINAFRKHLGEG